MYSSRRCTAVTISIQQRAVLLSIYLFFDSLDSTHCFEDDTDQSSEFQSSFTACLFGHRSRAWRTDSTRRRSGRTGNGGMVAADSSRTHLEVVLCWNLWSSGTIYLCMRLEKEAALCVCVDSVAVMISMEKLTSFFLSQQLHSFEISFLVAIFNSASTSFSYQSFKKKPCPEQNIKRALHSHVDKSQWLWGWQNRYSRKSNSQARYAPRRAIVGHSRLCIKVGRKERKWTRVARGKAVSLEKVAKTDVQSVNRAQVNTLKFLLFSLFVWCFQQIKGFHYRIHDPNQPQVQGIVVSVSLERHHDLHVRTRLSPSNAQ